MLPVLQFLCCWCLPFKGDSCLQFKKKNCTWQEIWVTLPGLGTACPDSYFGTRSTPVLPQ